MKALKEKNFDVRGFTNKTTYTTDSVLQDYTGDGLSLIPILYQSGYLTIVDYDPEDCEYTLAFPNNEVKYGMLNSLIPAYD